jgi:hypothetical protein
VDTLASTVCWFGAFFLDGRCRIRLHGFVTLLGHGPTRGDLDADLTLLSYHIRKAVPTGLYTINGLVVLPLPQEREMHSTPQR